MKVLKSPIAAPPDGPAPERYQFGPFRLDCQTRELWQGDEVVALTPKAFDTLRVLVTFGNRVVEKNELMKLVWRDSFVTEDSLTQNIATLRKALGDVPDRPQYIATVPRYGYRFIAPVHAVSDPASARAAPEELDGPSAVGLSGPTVDAPNESRGAGSGVSSADRMRRILWTRAALVASIVVLLIVGALVIASLRRTPSSAPSAMRFSVTAPEGTSFSRSASFLAVSPNGRFLAFLASRPGEETRIWVRPLDSLTARELTGTDGAAGPFWSPDSRYLGFFANGQLKTVSLLGEPPRVLCKAQEGVASGTWNREGVILFTANSGIYRTSSTGGAATPVTSVDRRRGEIGHVLPQFLPDGRRFVYTVRAATEGAFDSWIVLRSLDSSDDRPLFSARSQALYADPNYLLFLRDGALFAQPFDIGLMQLRGEPIPIPEAEQIGFNPAAPRGMFSVSETGVLAYRTSAVAELGWYDRAGESLGWIGPAAFDRNPALSRDGRRLAVSRDDPTTSIRSLWILDLGRGGAASRLTAHPSWETCAVWSPDDTRIIFARGAPDDGELYEKRGTAEERPLPYRPRGCPLDWSRDGRYVLYAGMQGHGSPGSGLWLVPLVGDGKPKPLVGTWPPRPQARISPDGRWLAYVSDVSGRSEIYVRSFPDGARSVQVSSQGGIEPQWRGDGRELFFIAADKKLMATPVMTGGRFRAGTPTALFSTDLDSSGRFGIIGRNQYLVTDDGQRFLINQPRPDAARSAVTVLVNWPATLKR